MLPYNLKLGEKVIGEMNNLLRWYCGKVKGKDEQYGIGMEECVDNPKLFADEEKM